MTPSQSSIEGRCIHHGLRASGLEAASPIERFTTGGFLPVMSDKLQFVDGATNVNRVLLCNGKVYYDLLAERKKLGSTRVAILRVEQFYPFPENLLVEQLDRFPNATDIRWVQEEPENMGGWTFMESRLLKLLGDKALKASCSRCRRKNRLIFILKNSFCVMRSLGRLLMNS